MNGFISYAHDDYRLFREFRKNLRAVERAFEIGFWADTSINAGYRWDDEIRGHIDAAEMFLLLLSPAFFASDYIWEKELPAIRARHVKVATVLVLPVVLRPCYWQLVGADRQAVPTIDGSLKPIVEWHPQSRGHEQARAAIADTIEAFYGRPPKHIDV
ncbi:MAG TPA: toll/interleukin-1 receptor domain-containing protein [Acetobacteraceae bacterium]|nr:toll/interleukin-1 receptor domain-containing protein [Acetobacteraceae bacterium]